MNTSLFRLLPVLAALVMAGVASPALSQGAAAGTAPARSQAKPPAKAPAKTSAKAPGKAAPKANSKSSKKGPVAAATPPRPSYGHLAGLHATPDELDLRSSVALVIDQETNEVLFQKNQSYI